MREHAAMPASAAPAFNTTESARPPAALSTPPKRTPPCSEAFRKDANDHNYFKSADYAHIPENFRKPPQPEERIVANSERLGEWHKGCAFAAAAWRHRCAVGVREMILTVRVVRCLDPLSFSRGRRPSESHWRCRDWTVRRAEI